MATQKTTVSNTEQHIYLSQISREIGQYGVTDKKCPVCGGDFTIQRKGYSYVIQCNTTGCLKMTSRGI